MTEAKKEALRLATIDAQNKADVVLDTVDSTSKEIINIRLDGAVMNKFVNRQIRFNIENNNDNTESARLESSGTFIPVIAGKSIVNASVTLEISY